MAIIKVDIEPFQDGSHTAEFTDRGNMRMVRYIVVSDNIEQDFPDNVVEAEDPNTGETIPAMLDPDPKSARRLVRGIRPSSIGGQWGDGNLAACHVDVEYNTQSNGGGFVNINNLWEADPLLRIADVQWSFQKRPVLAEYAHARWLNGSWTTGEWVTTTDEMGQTKRVYVNTKIENSAHQSFDPPCLTDETCIVGSMERWQETWDGEQALEYMLDGGAINSDWWFGFAPGMARIENITATRRFESGALLWRVRYEVQVQKHWIKVVKDVGTHDANGNVLVDSAGVPYSAPVNLDGNGAMLADQSDSVYLYFRMNPLLPFEPLNLI